MWDLNYKESWACRIDAFEEWSWRRLLRVYWTSRRPNLSIPKEISPEYSLEGLMLKLKLQSSGHLIWRTDSFEMTLILGKIESWSRKGWQKMRWLDGVANSVDIRLSSSGIWWWTGKHGILQAMGLESVGQDRGTVLNWTDVLSF